MGSLERRLDELEARIAAKATDHVVPVEVRVLLKAVDRHRARLVGVEPPNYSQEEIEEMRRDDLETVQGGGVVGQLRDDVAWQSEEDQAALDELEDESRARLKEAEHLDPEQWCEVWGRDEDLTGYDDDDDEFHDDERNIYDD